MGARWTRKPPPGTGLDVTHPSCPDHCWPFLSPQGTAHCLTRHRQLGPPNSTVAASDPSTIYAGSSTMVPGGKYGLSVRHNAVTDLLPLTQDGATADFVCGTTGITMLFAYRKLDGTTRQCTAVGINGSLSGSNICYCILPFNDGTIYWRYGGATEGTNQLSMAAAGVTFGDDLWAFTSGPRGMEIWQNGQLRASNSANPVRAVSNAFSFGWPAGTPNWSDLADLAFLMTWRNHQLTIAELRALFVNPWQVFQPPPPLPLLSITPAPFVAPTTMAWLPTYPDTVVHHKVSPASQQVAPTLPIAAQVLDAALFLPSYPDLVPHRRSQPASQSTPNFVQTPDLGATVDFFPTYPGQVYHHRPLPPTGTTDAAAFVAATIAVPDVLSGLTFAPSYPDQVPHRRGVPWALNEPPLFVGALRPLAWLPVYPSLTKFARPARQQIELFAPPPGELIAVAQRMAWRARYPDRLPPHRRPPIVGGAAFVALTLQASCVELVDVRLTSPALVAETLTTTGLIHETLTTPALIDERIC